MKEDEASMTPEDMGALFHVAQWVSHKNRKMGKTIRELAGSEENYRIIIREIDRVENQLISARTWGMDATLTLVEWLVTLEDFGWCCAYCQSHPFQIMSHVLPYPRGGTVLENCVPACYRCRGKRKNKGDIPAHIQIYFAGRKNKHASLLP